MKKVILFISVLFLVINCFTQKKQDFPVLKGPYLGQNPPGETPEIFAPGIVSTGFHEHSFPTFSPDGKEVHWTISFPIGQRGGGQRCFPASTLCMKEEDGKWTQPQFTNFKTLFGEGEGFFSPDGKKYFFISNSPLQGKGVFNIWVIKKDGVSSGKPVPLSSNINTENDVFSPTTTLNGTLYYKGFWEGGQYSSGIYRSEFKNGEFSDPQLLPESINSPHFDWTPFISPDESYLHFSSNRPGGYGSCDLYIAYRKKDGTWSESINLGPTINSEDEERYPYISPDGKYLFFVTDTFLFEEAKRDNYTYEQILDLMKKPGNGFNDIYWVDAKIIEESKPKDLNGNVKSFMKNGALNGSKKHCD